MSTIRICRVLLYLGIVGLLGGGCGGEKEEKGSGETRRMEAGKEKGGEVRISTDEPAPPVGKERAGKLSRTEAVERARERLGDARLDDSERLEAAVDLLDLDVDLLVEAYGERDNARIVRALIEKRAQAADEKVLPLIAGLFQKVQGEERIDFEQYFLAFDRRPVERLVIPLLHAGDQSLVMRAMDTLAKMKSAVGADSIAPLLRHPEVWRRIGAAHAIGEIGGDRAVERLMAVLDDPVYSVVNAALVGLGRLQARTAYERIAGMLADENFHVRKHAAMALGEIGDRRALPAVRALAEEDPDSGVRFMAGRALKKLEETQ